MMMMDSGFDIIFSILPN